VKRNCTLESEHSRLLPPTQQLEPSDKEKRDASLQIMDARDCCHVLLVDDSPVARKLVEQALPAEEYVLFQAGTASSAIELFEKHRPRLVITDWEMPDLTGLDLCKRIRSFRDSFTYVILLTSNSDTSNIVAGLQSGADEYLTKPFDPAELRARADVGRRIIRLHQEIEAKNRLLEQLALTDPLTGLPNRRAVEQWATREINAAKRHKFSFWVIVADLDQFKSINDTHGHDAGDAVLRKFSEIVQSNSRRSDICGRIGGDEFLMVITHGEREGLQVAVERIREEIERQTFSFGGQQVRVTASFGITGCRPAKDLKFETLVAQADDALYSAKRLGRNRVGFSEIVTV
jgi:two-component system, cell cycle response regulator